ncbi:MAG: rhomboid family intramembrane serine protease [Chthonomonas sp.]|nr:rhomboid family intramembrane serine protease [Chthonomonas sp.]
MTAQRTPWITLFLVAANILAAFFLFFSYPNWVQQFGFRSDEPSLRNAIVCLFLHENTMHLLGNMLALVAIGSWVEDALHGFKYVLVYFLGGLAGVAMHWAVTHNAGTIDPLIGASGAVACCTAYASVRYMWSRVPFGPKLKLPVVGVAGVWAALQLLGAFFRIGEQLSVSYWAHLGGILAGLGLAAILGAPKQASLQRGRKAIMEMEDRSPDALVAAAQAQIASHPNDVHAWESLVDAYHRLGDDAEERRAILALFDLSPAAAQAGLIPRLAELGALSTFPSIRRCKMADELGKFEEQAASVLLQSVIDGPPSDVQRPEAMLALATRLRSLDADRMASLVATLQREYPLHPVLDVARQRGMVP